MVIVPSLTCLVGCYGDSGVLAGSGGQGGYSIQRLDLEGVVGVGQQVGHGDGGVVEAHGAGQEAHCGPTRLTQPGPRPAALAHHVEGQVLPAARVLRPAPVQDHRRLVDDRDDIARGAGGPWRETQHSISFTWDAKGKLGMCRISYHKVIECFIVIGK